MQRLYDLFAPTHYDLHWDLTRIHDQRLVTGHVTITGTQRADDGFRLNADGLTISAVSLDLQPHSDYKLRDKQLIISHPGSGDVTIDIDFSVHVTDAMHGIYPCYYKLDGQDREVYATQFESHSAREAFPCIDEPEAKATFDISITSQEPVVLSNMPVVSSEELSDEVTTTTFATTPRMSSYLVAFVAGDLQRATDHTSDGVEVNIYATRAHTATSLTWALEQATRTIEFFNGYFGIPYPLPKSDHVALPDFSVGAMENWGLVTYRELGIIADPETATIGIKQYIASVIGHELSHQWFGNLVTMKWWDNLWLNESFANIMEYVVVDHNHPDWHFWFEFNTMEAVMALRRDCIDGVQPVQIAVENVEEVDSIFDAAIVYAKGSRLMRMMQVWVGEESFRAGLHQYFETYKYHNTTGDDLWGCLDKASGKDVGGLMNAWITQPGYPVVSASLNGSQLTLSQTQFFVGPHESSDRLWPIPLSASDASLPDILREQSLSVEYTSTEPLYLNQGDTGHFITRYDDALRARILSAIRAGTVPEVTRAQFLHEQTLLARGGYISSASLIDLLDAYRDETNDKVWNVMALAINDLKKFVDTDTVAEQHLRAFVGKLATPLYEQLGWESQDDDSVQTRELRTTMVALMLYSERADIIDRAKVLYRDTPIDKLDPELRGLILRTAVRYADDQTIIGALLDAYQEATSSEIRNDIATALCGSRDPEIITRLISLLTDTKLIRQQDTFRWYAYLLANRDSRVAAWQWLRDEWAWVHATFGSDKTEDDFPRQTASSLNLRSQLAEYIDFFTPLRDIPLLQRAIDMGILELEGRVDLIERDSPVVAETLSGR